MKTVQIAIFPSINNNFTVLHCLNTTMKGNPMKIHFDRLGQTFCVYAHIFKDQITTIDIGSVADAHNPDNFSDILYVNYMREIGTHGSATIDVQIMFENIASRSDAVRMFEQLVTVTKPVWQGIEYDPEYDSRLHRQILCVETGQVFQSVAHAANRRGIARPNLQNAIRYPGQRKTVDGHHWVRTAEPTNVP